MSDNTDTHGYIKTRRITVLSDIFQVTNVFSKN